MTPGLHDTDLLLAYRPADDTAVESVQRVREFGNPQINAASVLALLAWCQQPDDRIASQSFLRPTVIHTLSGVVSHKAVSMLSGLPPPCRLTPLDALVAATALIVKLPPYSRDPDRNAGVPGLTVLPAR